MDFGSARLLALAANIFVSAKDFSYLHTAGFPSQSHAIDETSMRWIRASARHKERVASVRAARRVWQLVLH
jgi:hypothetical protein